ncbi:MAG TPA: hypothetical protein VEA16_22805, partial [Vicinamibacterales bacterium]|nr:hypothetical protein [Vicinamibacterales bacterium]
TSLPGYSLLHGLLPLLSGLRNVARWGWLVLAGAAVLAGFGVAALERRKQPAGRAVLAAICVLITVEALRTPVGYTPVEAIPRIYDRLAGQPVVVAEFPFYSGASVSQNGPYVLANTRYFRPLMNGYSSFHPESFMTRARALNTFPSEQALAELQVAGVTHVLVHVEAFRDRYGEPALNAIDTITRLEFITEEDGIRLYRVNTAPQAPQAPQAP